MVSPPPPESELQSGRDFIPGPAWMRTPRTMPSRNGQSPLSPTTSSGHVSVPCRPCCDQTTIRTLAGGDSCPAKKQVDLGSCPDSVLGEGHLRRRDVIGWARAISV